ncbi:MAG: VOC family protein [Chloroflexi bacterium]|nr:VOC family protein [Chloroflexota bacterium]
MKVEKLGYVSIRVKDVKKATAFFGKILGTPFPEPKEMKDLDARHTIHPLGMELVEPLTANGPAARAIEKRGEGLSAISLRVSNIDEATARMKALGVRQIYGDKGVAIFHPADAFGVMIELTDHDLTPPIKT